MDDIMYANTRCSFSFNHSSNNSVHAPISYWKTFCDGIIKLVNEIKMKQNVAGNVLLLEAVVVLFKICSRNLEQQTSNLFLNKTLHKRINRWCKNKWTISYKECSKTQVVIYRVLRPNEQRKKRFRNTWYNFRIKRDMVPHSALIISLPFPPL